MNDFARNKTSFQQASLNFIETELILVRTFCGISKQTNDPEKRARNIENAERAFQAAVKSFRDFREETQDWTTAKAALDDAERELDRCR